MKTSLGAIVKYMPPGLEECRDGKFTTSANSGRCSRHGGVSMPGSMKASRASSREAKFRRDAAAAPKVIIIPNRSAPASATSASLPPSMKPARVPYEGRCRFRNKVCRELDEQYEVLRKQAYDEGLVDDRLAPGASPHSREQHIGKLLKDINTVILSITKKEDAGSIKYIQEKLRALTMRMNILRSEKLAAQQKLEQPAQAMAAPEIVYEYPLNGVENDIPYQAAYDAHRGTSFSPEKRAKQEIAGHVEYMVDTYKKLAHNRTPEQITVLNKEFSRFREAYVKRRLDLLRRRSRLLSTMVTGSSNFPVHRQNKLHDAEHRATGEFIKWEENVLQRIRSNGYIYPERRSAQPIRSGSSTAIDQLTEKLQKLEANQERMKLANKIIRSGKDVTARLMSEIGLTEALAIELQKPDFAGRVGFADYELTNNNAEIRRTRQRLEAETQNQAQRAQTGSQRQDFNGGHMLQNVEENRLQIFFDSIPPADLRSKLKGRGFRWAPSVQAWQRQLTRAAMQDATAILGIDLPKATPTPASLPPSMKPVSQSNAATGIELIPIQAINIRRDWFQNRATPYSERSVENIVQAVQAGNFRWSQLDPVTLWAGPDGKLYMLSGHSRLEAFDRLCRSGAVVDGRSFCDIPAKIEANINLEQARRLALESNTLSTKETELERAEYYRAMRSQGKDADRDARRLEGDNWSTIIALSYLNPSGKTYTALRALEKGDATSKGNMRTIGRWIGNARAKYAILTNFHEDELYNWLVDNLGYGTRAGQVSNEREFNTRLASIINRRSTFGHLEDSLNIAANVTLSPVEAQYNQQVAEAAELIKVLQKQLDEKIREYRSRNATESQILELTAPLSAQLTRARIDYQSLMQKKGDIAQYAKQEVNLFANLSGTWFRRKQMTA